MICTFIGVPLENEGEVDAVNQAHLATVKEAQNALLAKFGEVASPLFPPSPTHTLTEKVRTPILSRL